MKTPFCNQVQAWLHEATNESPAEELVTHVAGCNYCRGALALVLGDVRGMLRYDNLYESCDACQHDLAAYVEAEAKGWGTEAYPHVWWHLWTCGSCAETYRLLRVLIDSEASGEADCLVLPRRQALRISQKLPKIRVPQLALAHALTPHTQLGVAWGPATDELFLAEEDEGSHQLSLSVVPQPTDGCTVIVRVTPPLSGLLLLQLGQTLFRTEFDCHGTARVTSIPLTMLTVPGGPDLVVMIEPTGSTHAG